MNLLCGTEGVTIWPYYLYGGASEANHFMVDIFMTWLIRRHKIEIYFIENVPWYRILIWIEAYTFDVISFSWYIWLFYYYQWRIHIYWFSSPKSQFCVFCFGQSISPDQAKRFTKFRERKGLIDKDVVEWTFTFLIKSMFSQDDWWCILSDGVLSHSFQVRTDRSLLFYDGDDNPNVYIMRDILLTYSFYNFDLGYCQVVSFSCHYFCNFCWTILTICAILCFYGMICYLPSGYEWSSLANLVCDEKRIWIFLVLCSPYGTSWS